MSLLDQLEKDYITAYKAKDSVKLSVLRHLKTALKNFQVEHLRAPTDDDAIVLIQRQCKQRQDAIDQFTAAKRLELAEKEAAEYAALAAYLPEPLQGEELTAAIDAAINEVGAKGMKDMGRVMQSLTALYKARLDGKAVSLAVKAALSR